ncbi:MAG: DEAD/DEAH box helicase family protein [Spirochaetales bacterium]|nr:DEAD/DEAH box helicase family protein [Spirochaetales bacterium]
MGLKNYQEEVVRQLQDYFRTAAEARDKFRAQTKDLSPELRASLNWTKAPFESSVRDIAAHPYVDAAVNGLGEHYPRFVIKMPTGGGKTLIAVEAIREYATLYARRRTGLAVWVVPSETIFRQTIDRLRDKSDFLRQFLDQSSGNRTLILEKGQRLRRSDIEENLVVLFVMIQSISRRNGREALKVFQDSGGFEDFFPAPERYDEHRALLQAFPNLDTITGPDALFQLVTTSLGNAVRVSRPLIIIDEIHRVFSDQARETINGLNPEMVIGLSATPNNKMNILVSVTGYQLKEEQMVKLDMHIYPPPSANEDWKAMLRRLRAHREKLEKAARKYHKNEGLYIRPIALVQAEAAGAGQKGRGKVHSEEVRDFLISDGIPADQVAIKTGSQNDIEDIDILSGSCPVRYIITVQALREGWDCPFAYLLGVIPNAQSHTGMTQLVGRILRQPYAAKTGVQDLDESHIYYCRGEVQQVLNRVQAGFRDEGLEDLVASVRTQTADARRKARIAKIRDEFRKHESAFYLPVWMMKKDQGEMRRFNYARDIRPFLSLDDFSPSEELAESIRKTAGETTDPRSWKMTVDPESKASRLAGGEQEVAEEISIEYLARRFSEIIPNPFMAHRVARRSLDILQAKLGADMLENHFGYVAFRLHQALDERKRSNAEARFLSMLDKRELQLVVSDDPTHGWRIPKEDEIPPEATLPYGRYLFEALDYNSMNALEHKVARLLEQQDKLLWWFRNRTRRTWYALDGWEDRRIKPDFIAARKKDTDEVEIVFVLEAKGKHLKGNEDSLYKEKLLGTITDQRRKKRIVAQQQGRLPFELNREVEGHFVEDGREEQTIRGLFD